MFRTKILFWLPVDVSFSVSVGGLGLVFQFSNLDTLSTKNFDLIEKTGFSDLPKVK